MASTLASAPSTERGYRQGATIKTARVAAAAGAVLVALTVGGEIRLHGQAAFAGVETPIVVARGKQTDTAIDGTVVVWTDTSSGNADISYSDGIVHAAIVKPGDQHLSAVSGTTIAYTNQTQADPRPDLHVRYSNGHSHAHQQ